MNAHFDAQGMHQLLVFGGGLTPAGELTPESTERTLATIEHVREHRAYIGRVIFTGGRSILTPEVPDNTTESGQMSGLFCEEMKGEIGSELVKVEPAGRTSIDNIVRSEPLLLDMPVGRVTHSYHQPRTRTLTDRAFWQPTFPIEVKSDRPDTTPLSEHVLRGVTRGLLLGVKRGDMAELARRAELEAALFSLSPKKIIKATLFRYHTSLRS